MNKTRSIISLLTLIALMALTVKGTMIWLECRAFHHPSKSDPVPVTQAGPGRIISTMDLQRELNRRDPKLKLAVDGVYGPATKAAHERACGDQYAKELMARMEQK